MHGVTHVVHLATCKETPDAGDGRDRQGPVLALRGVPRLARRTQLRPDRRRRRRRPLPLRARRARHRGDAAPRLSRLLRALQSSRRGDAGSNTPSSTASTACCLRAPWIMEKDDFRYTLSFGDDVFGAPVWKTRSRPRRRRCPRAGAVPLLLDADGEPLKRNFVHVDDLVVGDPARARQSAARGELFNIAMDEPVDYGELAAYLATTRGLPAVDIPSRFHSTWLDNAKAQASSSAGARATTCRASSRPPGPTNAAPTIRGGSGIRARAHTLSTPPRSGPKRRCACAAWVRMRRDPAFRLDFRDTGTLTCYRSPAAGHPAGHGSRPPISRGRYATIVHRLHPFLRSAVDDLRRSAGHHRRRHHRPGRRPSASSTSPATRPTPGGSSRPASLWGEQHLHTSWSGDAIAGGDPGRA